MRKVLKRLFFAFVFLFLVLAGGVFWRQLTKKEKVREEQQEKEAREIYDKLPHMPKFVKWKVALLADVHNSWENLRQAVEMVSRGGFDLVIFLGDLTNLGSLEEFEEGKKALDVLKIPYYIVPGNHDIWYSRRDGKLHDAYFDEVFADRFLSCFQQEGINFVFIDNSDEKQGIGQDDWQEMKACLVKDLPAFVFVHEPLYHPANDRIMGKYNEVVASQASELLKFFCDKKTKLVLAGHLHSFAKYFYDCPITNNSITNNYNLPMLVSGALTSERNFQSPRFLQLVIFEDGSFEEKEIVLSP